MSLSHEALRVLQRMRGPEGGVFDRDMPLNVHRCGGRDFLLRIGNSTEAVSRRAFEELRDADCIVPHIQCGDWEQWHMSPRGFRQLRDAGMDTEAGLLTRDDIGWLAGTGRFVQ